MGSKTNIEWTDSTWSPMRGCSRVSRGCDNCYAMRFAHRFNTPSETSPFHGLTLVRDGHLDWSGEVRLVPSALSVPLKWTRPRDVFVNSQSDTFARAARYATPIFGVMAACQRHRFQVLTKRPGGALDWARRVEDEANSRGISCPQVCMTRAVGYGVAIRDAATDPGWPLPNVMLGVSVEDQEQAEVRVPLLMKMPAALRFLSCEPLLGPLDLRRWLARGPDGSPQIAWVIVGGESGPGSREMRQEWVASVRDQCQEAGCKFFFKQWGGVNKSAAGRSLDGRTWSERP